MFVSNQSNLSIPIIAISSCLLGERVRYDGRDKKQPRLAEFFQEHCQLVPVCPEIEMGLGVPRAPIEVVVIKQQLRLREVSEPHRDFTDLAQETAKRVMQNIGMIDGWVFKARSPSCGTSDTPIYNHQGELVKTGQGMFASHMVTAMPWLPYANETQLQRDSDLQQFFKRIHILHQMNNWFTTDRSYESLLQLEQSIRPTVANIPEVQLEKLHALIQNKEKSIDDRFYQYRQELMHLVSQI